MGDIFTKNSGLIVTRPAGDVIIGHPPGGTPSADTTPSSSPSTGFRVLYLSSTCQGEPLTVDREFNRVHQDVRSIDAAWADSIEHWPDVRLDQFGMRLLQATGPTIVHFAGHGDARGRLLFRDHDGEPTYMEGTGVCRLLGPFSAHVRLVVLNACYSAALAERLVETIDVVIGMSDRVDDDTAILFAQSFYAALAARQSVRNAFDIASGIVIARLIDVEDVPQLVTRHGAHADRMYFPIQPQRTPTRPPTGHQP